MMLTSAKPTDYRQLSELDGSQLIRGVYRSTVFHPHTHNVWSIGYVAEGANVFRYERRQRIAHKGSVCLVNPGDVHTGGGNGMVYLNFQPSRAFVTRALMLDDACKLEFQHCVVADARVGEAVGQLLSRMWQPMSELAREELAICGVRHLFRRCATENSSDYAPAAVPKAVGLGKDFIEARIGERIRLPDIAAAAGLSEAYFCRLFHRTVGMTISAYVRNRRAERARQEIVRGSSLAEAALDAGFADQAHMTRVMRSTIGVTPSALRQ